MLTFRSEEYRVGVEPTFPPYESGVLATRRPVLEIKEGPEGLEPSPNWLRARCAATNTLVPCRSSTSSNLIGPAGIEPTSPGYRPRALPLSYGPARSTTCLILTTATKKARRLLTPGRLLVAGAAIRPGVRFSNEGNKQAERPRVGSQVPTDCYCSGFQDLAIRGSS